MSGSETVLPVEIEVAKPVDKDWLGWIGWRQAVEGELAGLREDIAELMDRQAAGSLMDMHDGGPCCCGCREDLPEPMEGWEEHGKDIWS